MSVSASEASTAPAAKPSGHASASQRDLAAHRSRRRQPLSAATHQVSKTPLASSPASRIFSEPTIASGRFAAKMATSSVGSLLPMSEPDSAAGGRPSRPTTVEPGVDQDEGRGAHGERDAGAPRILVEGVLEELEGDGSDERAGCERQQGRRDTPRRRAPDAEQGAEREGARGEHGEQNRRLHRRHHRQTLLGRPAPQDG